MKEKKDELFKKTGTIDIHIEVDETGPFKFNNKVERNVVSDFAFVAGLFDVIENFVLESHFPIGVIVDMVKIMLYQVDKSSPKEKDRKEKL